MALYLFTQKGCINCPAYKARLEESKIAFKEIDIYSNKFEELQFDLLENNIFLVTTPSLVLEENGKMEKVELEDVVCCY